jgi:hypothetical protein
MNGKLINMNVLCIHDISDARLVGPYTGDGPVIALVSSAIVFLKSL